MKVIFISALFFLTLSISAQCDGFKIKHDDFSGSTRILKGPYILGTTEYQKQVKARILNDTSHQLIMDVWMDHSFAGCVTKESQVLVKFTNGDILALDHRSGTSCSKWSSISVQLSKGQYYKLTTLQPQMIKLTYSKGSEQIHLDDLQLFNDLPCLLELKDQPSW